MFLLGPLDLLLQYQHLHQFNSHSNHHNKYRCKSQCNNNNSHKHSNKSNKCHRCSNNSNNKWDAFHNQIREQCPWTAGRTLGHHFLLQQLQYHKHQHKEKEETQ